MSNNIEMTGELESIEQLTSEVLDKMDEVKPIEVASANHEKIDTPNIEDYQEKQNISYRMGSCMCSCDLTCSRA